MTALSHLYHQSVLSFSAEETHAVGCKFGKELPSHAVVYFFGNLAAGKTTFIRGLVEGRGGDPFSVQSPTFAYLNTYPGVMHFDLYRLADKAAFFQMGFEEYLEQAEICCLEWAERLLDSLPLALPSIPQFSVHIAHVQEGVRKIFLSQLA